MSNLYSWIRRQGSRRVAVPAGGAFVAVLAGILIALSVAVPAQAHDPLFLTEDDMTPETGPLLPDGTISFALYGEIGGPGDSRGFQVSFQDGDPAFFELLLPDEGPENLLVEADLPSARIVAPDGTETIVGGPIRGSFFEPFTSTNYLRLDSVSYAAVAGTYDVWITGPVPARFTFAVGTRETFGTPVERAEERLDSFAEVTGALDDWLAAPPSSPGSTAGGATATADSEDSTLASDSRAALDTETAPASVEVEPAVESVAASPALSEDGGLAPAVLAILASLALITPVGLAWTLKRRSRNAGDPTA